MKKNFGKMPSGEAVSLYTISCGGLTANVTDLGATLVSLFVPDTSGQTADVVLGFDNAEGYLTGGCFLGATVGRNANRTQGASFSIGENTYHMTPNESCNNLHSGPDCYHTRLWDVAEVTEASIKLHLYSPDGDQGFPGNADIYVTYQLDSNGGLHIIYDGKADKNTVFNLTNHSYFNLAGQNQVNKAMNHILTMPSRWFNPDDAQNIPTGEQRPVDGTPFDFRSPKPIGRDINEDYEPLRLQGGYDHNFEVFCNPCATLHDPESGRTMTVETDCPGVQLYAGNFLNDSGKSGMYYGKRSGIALETQYAPDSLHHSEWPQPIVKAGEAYHSETVYRFI